MKIDRPKPRPLAAHPLPSDAVANQQPAAFRRPCVGPFFTVQQIAERHPAFKVRTLRHWIFGASSRRAWRNRQAIVIPGNGFDRVMVRKGRRIFINEDALFAWLAQDPAVD